MIPTIFATVLALPVLALAQYQLVKEYAGDTFFDDWNFYNNYDNLTNGNAFYVSSQQASRSKLAFINDAGNAIMKVDNSSTVQFNSDRNSVRISTKDLYTVGSVWVSDMLHLPYGCSVWPAWWSQAQNWPDGGEIDTLEGVNQATMGHMGLHTTAGCTHSTTAVQSSTLINSTDCDILANENQGCIITDPSTASYGAGFAAAGGGIFVTEFATKGVSIWFFNRSNIPSALQGNVSSVNTTDLGIPVANWPSDGCDIASFFQPQHLVYDITLCGDYAGNINTFSQTCTGICYQDWVLGSPSNYDTAYFEVQYVRVYGVPGELTIIPTSAGQSLRLRSYSADILALMAFAVAGLFLTL